MSDEITIDEFNKAEHVEGADKLLKLTLDLGGTTRTVFAGIKTAYDPAKLEGQEIFLVSPDAGAQPGMKVK